VSLVPRRWGACLVALLLGLLSPGIAHAAGGDGAGGEAAGVRTAASGGDASRSCRRGDRGRLLGFERVASHPTAADARAYFDSWVEFYQDFYRFPASLPVDIDHGFDTYKVTYCTVDVAPPGRSRPAPTIATGNVSVPRKAGPLDTVAYLHGTSVSFYDAPSNPDSSASSARTARASTGRRPAPSSPAPGSSTSPRLPRPGRLDRAAPPLLPRRHRGVVGRRPARGLA